MSLISAALIVVLSLAIAQPEDWSRFRGPNGSGLAETSGLPAEFGPLQNVVWKVDLPEGFSSPVISGNRHFPDRIPPGSTADVCSRPRDRQDALGAGGAAQPEGKAGSAKSSGGCERGDRRTLCVCVLRRLRADCLRRRRSRAVAKAPWALQQHLRHGRLPDPGGRRGGAGVRSEHRLVHRGVRQAHRQGTLADTAAGGPQRAFDADRSHAAGRPRADPAARIVPAHRVCGWHRQAALVGRRIVVRVEVGARRRRRHALHQRVWIGARTNRAGV